MSLTTTRDIQTMHTHVQRTLAFLSCVTCGRAFTSDQHAVILRHVAYGYDFAHAGDCLDAARERIFAEPGYDCQAFDRDACRLQVLWTAPADGWAAVMPAAPDRVLRGAPVTFEPLSCWALVEHGDGSRRVEGIIRDAEWEDEPGGAEFPEARRGRRGCIGYACEAERTDPIMLHKWEAVIRARYQLG